MYASGFAVALALMFRVIQVRDFKADRAVKVLAVVQAALIVTFVATLVAAR